MASIVEALDTFQKCLLNRENPSVAEGCVCNILNYFEEELSINERNSALSALFDEKCGIISLAQKAFPLKTYKNAIVETFGLLKYLAHHFKDHLTPFVRSIKDLCVSCLSRFDTSANEKEKACDALLEVLVSGSWSQELNVNSLINDLMNKASHSKKYGITPKVLQKIFVVLGSTARFYPEHMPAHSEVLFKLLCFELEKQKNKGDISSVIGCLEGLAEFLYTFSQPLEESDKNRSNVYGFIKFFASYESDRKLAQRAALKILHLHCHLFQDYLYNDYLWWHQELRNKWLHMNNLEDQLMGRNVLQTLYATVSNKILLDNSHENSSLILKYFINHFRENLFSGSISDKEEAIEGLGKFSQSCLKHMSEENVQSLFTLLMQQAQQLHLGVNDINIHVQKSLKIFPHYVKSIANIIVHMERSDFDLNSLQRMAVVLIQMYSVTPTKLRDAIVDSLLSLFCSIFSKQRSMFDEFISTTIYQSVIRTCSSDQTKEFANLWDAMCDLRCYRSVGVSHGIKQEILNKLYDMMIKVILRLIKRLDLQVFNKADNFITDLEDPNLGLEARKPSDFKIFINLIDFFILWLPETDYQLFGRWVESFTNCILTELCKNPLVSGYYKLLTLCFRVCEKISFFEEKENGVGPKNEALLDTVCKSLLHLFVNLKSQKGDLQVSCIRLFLEIPMAILPKIRAYLVEILQTAFRVGRSDLKLASEALVTLKKWKTTISSEEIKLVIPELGAFLQIKGLELQSEKELELLLSQGRRCRRRYSLARKKLIELPESELLILQQNILHFLGQLDFSTTLALLHADEDSSLSWGHTKKLKFKAPFKDMNIFIYLDALMPHVVGLSVSCTERHTRIAACELLHALILFMLGTCKQMDGIEQNEMAKLFERVFLPLLQLGCDSDDVVHQLFNPLVCQLAHWYSSSFQLRSKNTEVYVNTLLDNIAHPSDASLRDISAKCLKEFVEWSIKQHVSGKYERSSFNIQTIVKRICVLSSHPSASKRLGGALAFNSVYRVLREDEVIVDELFLELLYFMVKNFALSKPSPVLGVKNESEQSVDHILRVLKEKAFVFNRSSKLRRKPPEFGGDKLIDAVRWLFQQCNSEHKDCRRKCMEMVCVLVPCLEDYDSVDMLVKSIVEEESLGKLVKIVERSSADYKLHPLSFCSSVLEKSSSHIMLWLQQLASVLDFYGWLTRKTSIVHLLLSHSESIFIKVLKLYTVMVTREEFHLDNLMYKFQLSPGDRECYNEMKSTVTIYLFEFLYNIIKCCKEAYISQLIAEDMLDLSLWKLVSKCIFQYSFFGFDARNDEKTMELSKTVKSFLLVLQEPSKQFHCVNKMVEILMENFTVHAAYLKENLLGVLKSGNITLDLKASVKGLILIQENGLYQASEEEKDELQNSLIKILFDSVVDSSLLTRKAVALEPSLQDFGELVLEFACSREKQIHQLITFLMDSNDLNLEAGHLQHGEHFQATFSNSILMSLLNYTEKTLEVLLKNPATPLTIRVFSLLEQLCSFAKEIKTTGNSLRYNLHVSLLKYWTVMEEWASFNTENKLIILNILIYITESAGGKTVCLEKHVAGKWILTSLSDQSLDLSLKSKILDLLPSLISSPVQISNDVKESIHVLLDSFPKDASELSEGSLDFNYYLLCFGKLLKSLQISGSIYILERIIAMTTSDEKHICNKNIQEAIPNFVVQLKTEEQCRAIDVAYNVFIDTVQYAPEIRINSVKNFIIPLVKHCILEAVIQFFTKHIGEIIDLLKTPLEAARIIQMEHKIISKIGSWCMIELLFSVIPADKLESSNSIPEAARGHLDPTKTLNGDLSTLAVYSRSLNLPSIVKDNSDLRELLRKMKCSAYIALMIIVCNTQENLKFYTGLLFRERKDSLFPEKNTILWENIVDCTKKFSFPIIWEQIPKQRKALIGIRQKNDSQIQYLATDTQILVNSTLAEDVTLFDLSTSIYQTPSNSFIDPNSCMEVSLEDDDLNQHECMSTICAVITRMTVKNLYDFPKETGPTPSSLPSWMEELRRSMTSSKHENVRVFLTKVILNNEKIFKPYASFWLYPLMQIIVNGCLGYEINYMVMDVICLLLSWHDVAKPSRDESEKMLANQILEFLVVNLPSNRRDIFKYNLDIVRTLVEVWKSFICVPYQKLMDLLTVPSKNDITKGEAGIHLASIFLANGVQPWNDLGKQLFLNCLVSFMTSSDKLLCPSAEVVGLTLKYMDPEMRGNLGEENTVTMNAIKQKIYNMEKSSDNYLHCLHCISRHYAPILDDFLKNIMYYLSKVSGKFKIMCLEMICNRLEAFGESVIVELESKKLLPLLDHGDPDLQVAVLQLLMKMIPLLTSPKQQTVLTKCINLSTVRSSTCRLLVYKILIWAHNQNILSETGKDILIRGIMDSDLKLQEFLYNFWNDGKHISSQMPVRFLNLLSTMYSPQTEQHFLSDILLFLLDPGVFSVEYNSEMFQHPLSQCDFKQLEVILSDHKQRASLAPLFSQTLSTHATQRSLSSDFKIIATQGALAFKPTIENSSNIPEAISSTISSSLMFNAGSETVKSYSSYGSFSGENKEKSLGNNLAVPFKTKRLLKDMKSIGRMYAASAVRREVRRQELQQSRVKNRELNVSLYRTYRMGDFPDVQIPFSSILKPLQILSRSSAAISRQVIMSLFSSILQELEGEELSAFSLRIVETFQNILQKTPGSPVLVGCILEMILVCGEQITLKTDVISSVSQKSGLSMLGSLVLEEKLIGLLFHQSEPLSNSREDESNSWLRLAELYQDMEEWDVVHGIFNEKLECCNSAKLALKAESEGNWKDAQNFYMDSINSEDPDNQKDYYYDAFFQCLAHLSDWKQLHKCVLEQVDEDRNALWADSWNKEHLLPQLFVCEINLLGTGDSSVFIKALEFWLKDQEKSEFIQSNLTEELAVLYALEQNFVKSQVYTRNCYVEFLNNWINMNSVNFKQKASFLRDIHRLSELQVYLDFVCPTNKNKEPDKLVSCWRASLPTPMCSLLDWDRKINYRKQFLKYLRKEFPDLSGVWKEVEIEMQLAMVDASLAQNNLSVADKYLMVAKESISSLPLKLKLLCFLGHGRYLMLKSLHSVRERDKLQWTMKAISTFNECDPCKSVLWDDNWLLQLNACQLMGDVACGMWEVLRDKPELFDSLSEECKCQIIQWSGSQDKYESVIHAIHSCGLTYLHKAVNISIGKEKTHNDFCDTAVPSAVADAYFKIAEYHDRTNDSIIGDTNFLIPVLRSIKYGSKGAHCMFPRLLQMSVEDSEWEEKFISESSEIPEWMFLKWINQIMACLDKPIGKVLHHIAIRVAKAYPQALTWPYHISREKYNVENIPPDVLKDLDSTLLQNPLIETFLTSMSCLAQPEMILLHHIEDILKFMVNGKGINENVCKACENLKLRIEQINECELIHGSIFREMAEYYAKIVEALELIFKNEEGGVVVLKQLKLQLETKAQKMSSRKVPLEKYSPWLSKFQMSYWGDYLELPGQYSGDTRPLSKYFVRIAGFSQEIQVIRSQRLPVKLIIIGNNAKEYPFLVKYGEDLRQDQRIQQLFDVMNIIFSKDSACLHRQLNIITYKVIPLSCKIGMIEWIENTRTLKNVLVSILNKQENENYLKAYELYRTWLKSSDHSEDLVALHRSAYKHYSRQETVKSFEQRVDLIPWDILRRAFMHVCKNTEEFFSRRQKFACSYATLCISHWILGIGDRHLENCLIKEVDGTAVGIDFGYAFGCGIQFVPVPELMPFRLTPHIVHLMEPFKKTGLLEGTMIHCLRALRNNSQILLATMEVFVHEPSLNWIELAQRRYQEEESEWLPQEKLLIAKKKLEGINPVLIGSQELKSGHKTSKYLLDYLKVLQGEESLNIRSKAGNKLSVQEQVDCLIDLATDYHLLGKTWIGWDAWI